MKFSFPRIVAANYSLSDKDGVRVLEQDNQLFRQIRRITADSGKFNQYIFFVDGRGCKNHQDELLHILTEGICVNGWHYYAAERSASMVRNMVFSFVREDIFDELSEIVGNGVHPDKIVVSKYMAYRALLMSSCFCLEDYLPKIIVVDDYYRMIHNQSVRYLEGVTKEGVDADGVTHVYKQEELRDGVVDIKICPADGAGVIHPIVASEIRAMLGCEGTSFMLRAPYIKGVVHEVDYSTFLSERGVDWITDIWGERHSVYEPMIILTKSQYKCFGYYARYGDVRDYEAYWYNFRRYHHCIGIARWNYSVDEEPIYTRCNYQVLQTLRLPVNDFLSLADYSRAWAEKVVCGDPIYTFAFLGLFADKQRPANDYVRAVMKNPMMLRERTVKKYLRWLLRKYIDQMKCGKILLKSTFRIITPDLIALMEHIGGLEPNGCLAAGECWSRGVDGEMAGRHLVTRNPHISATENNVLTAVTSPVIHRYLSHLQGVVMLDSRSVILQRLNGADCDGDLLLVFDDQRLLDGVDETLIPTVDLDDKKSALSEPFCRESINACILRTLDNRIGEYSNLATCYHNKDYQNNANPSGLRQQFVDNIDYISILNGREIDSAKTGIKYTVPKYISRKAKPFPYFMRYAGDYYMKHHTFNKTQRSNMNRLCFEIERWDRELRFGREKKDSFDYSIMIDGEIPMVEEKYVAIEELHRRFSQEMAEHAKFCNLNKKKELSEYGYDVTHFADFELDYAFYYNLFAEEAHRICPNNKELANYAVRSCYTHKNWNAKFPWVVAPTGIIANIEQVKIKLPMCTDIGTEYLGRKYVLEEAMLSAE